MQSGPAFRQRFMCPAAGKGADAQDCSGQAKKHAEPTHLSVPSIIPQRHLHDFLHGLLLRHGVLACWMSLVCGVVGEALGQLPVWAVNDNAASSCALEQEVLLGLESVAKTAPRHVQTQGAFRKR